MGLLAGIKENSRRISDAYAGTAAYYELATTNLSLYRTLKDAVASHASGKLLDAGAGRMAYREMLETHCDAYESLDAASDGSVSVDHVADLQDTGLPDAQYDTIICTQVLQHLPEPARAIGEIARMLKPGGKAIFSVPHLVWLHNEPHDYMRFTGHGMKFLLEAAGLRSVALQPVGGLICFLAYAPSTLALAFLWPFKPVFLLGLLCNRMFIRLALLADRLVGIQSLYPTNYVVVAEKPLSGTAPSAA